jgi:hypothetical protein
MATKQKKDQHLAPDVIAVRVKNDHIRIVWTDNVLDAQGKSVRNEVDTKYRYEPHPDLVKELKALAPHMAFLADQESGDGFEAWTDERVEAIVAKYVVRGVKFVRKDGAQVGVSINGYRILNGGRVLNMTAPIVRFQTEGESYQFADHVEEIADNLRIEVLAYLNGKRAEDGQTTLGFSKAEAAEGEDEEGDGNGEGEA